MTLSPTQTRILTAAAQHEQHLAKSPPGLPAGARNTVFRSTLRNGLLAEVAAPPEHVALAWRRNEDGTPMVARVTEAGLRAIGVDPAASQQPAGAPYSVPGLPEQHEPTPPSQAVHSAPQALRATLRGVAAAVLVAWDAGGHGSADLATEIERLRPLVAIRPARGPSSARSTPRPGTKQAAVLALLRRPEGASGPQLQEATGWAPHTVRGFLAGLGQKGVQVTVLERVRQVGPGREGTKGSYTVYRVADAG